MDLYRSRNFFRSSPSLRTLQITGDGTKTSTTPPTATTFNHATSSILESISRNTLLVKLELAGLVFERPSLIENVLATTLTLAELIVVESGSGNSEVYHAFRRGFERNKTLEKLHWRFREHSASEEIFFGLANHPKLKTLVLDLMLTGASSQALRALLQKNEILESFLIYLQPVEDVFPTLVPILLGLADNRGVTRAQFTRSCCAVRPRTKRPVPSAISSATAWVELLRKNTSMKDLEVNTSSIIWREGESAIAQGLGGTMSLEKLCLHLSGGSLHGPTWQAMMQRNRSLKEIELQCASTDDIESIARGIPQNISLKTLVLSGDSIGDTAAATLAEALLSNNTLESLDLSGVDLEGPVGAAVIPTLWRNQTLRHLNLSEHNLADDFPTDLPRNFTLETLDVSSSQLGSDHCRAICESLRENWHLREINLGDDDIYFDEACATALSDLLDSMLIQVLHFHCNQAANQGIAVLAHSLRRNSSLRELNLEDFEIGNKGLLHLGDALVENSTLEILVLGENPFDQGSLTQFFQLLPRMEGLKKLSLDEMDGIGEDELWSAVVDGLRKNTAYRVSLTHTGDVSWPSEAPSRVKALIGFYLKLNRNGRKFLQV